MSEPKAEWESAWPEPGPIAAMGRKLGESIDYWTKRALGAEAKLAAAEAHVLELEGLWLKCGEEKVKAAIRAFEAEADTERLAAALLEIEETSADFETVVTAREALAAYDQRKKEAGE